MRRFEGTKSMGAVVAALCSITIALSLVSCDPFFSSKPQREISFDFSTTREYGLHLDLSTQSIKAGIRLFQIYETNPIAKRKDGSEYRRSGLTPLFQGVTDRSGQFHGKLLLPAHVDSVFLYTEQLGSPNLFTVQLSHNDLIVSVQREHVATKMTKTSAFSTITVPRTTALGEWGSWGFPYYLLPDYDDVSSEYLSSIESMVPQGVYLPDYNPGLLNPNAVNVLKVIEHCTIDVTFVHEGAGYMNSLGYYYYPTGNPPTDLSAIDKYIIFPNTSYYGSGGSLLSGDKVRLKYWDKVGQRFVDQFPSGVTVGWFLVANGYHLGYQAVTPGLNIFSSDPALNPESNLALRQHCLQFYDAATQRIAITFEDMQREDPYCDQDFNDAIFYATASPIRAIETIGITTLARMSDRDSDGVPDLQDEFPDDTELAYTVHFPSKGMYGTLAYEDLWPSSGDYDLNDLVIGYNTIQYYNSQNRVIKAVTDYQVKAVGASFRNGFAVQLGVSPLAISSVHVEGRLLTSGAFKIDENGLEQDQSLINIPLFDDAFKLFNVSAGDYINTRMDEAKITAKRIAVVIEFSSPQDPATVGSPPYNAYMVIGSGEGERGKEVHLTGHRPTDLANKSLFSTGQDATNPARNRYYVDKNNMPFALHVPYSFAYPIESAPILSGYLRFRDWANTLGKSYSDWYINLNSSYRTPTFLYTK